jgi:hypothetical protein
MLTTELGLDIARYHDRQIVILENGAWLDWLDRSIPAKSLIKPLPAGTLSVQQVGCHPSPSGMSRARSTSRYHEIGTQPRELCQSPAPRRDRGRKQAGPPFRCPRYEHPIHGTRSSPFGRTSSARRRRGHKGKAPHDHPSQRRRCDGPCRRSSRRNSQALCSPIKRRPVQLPNAYPGGNRSCIAGQAVFRSAKSSLDLAAGLEFCLIDTGDNANDAAEPARLPTFSTWSA